MGSFGYSTIVTESPIETVPKAEMNPVYDFTCLGGSTTNMCKNCNLYAREMVNKRYNKVIKALSDDDGNLKIDRAEKFEKVFSEELNKRALVMVNNFVRTDQYLLLHIRKRIAKEKIKAKPSKININFVSTALKKDETGNTHHKYDGEDVETISTAPDSGVCRRLWNPTYYELPIESEPLMEDIMENIKI